MLIDIHSHVYTPSFVTLLEARTSVPYIRKVPDSNTARLVILPGEDDQSKPIHLRGRPVGPEYWDIGRKIDFMNQHKIDISVISLANPWLDFLPASDAAAAAKCINDDMERLCALHPTRLFAFGTLPLSGSAESIVAEVKRLKTLQHLRGVIIGTSGMGEGLDDPRLDQLWEALESTQTLAFLHPHYGLPSQVYGPRAREYGHVLPLALGFPLETTIAVTRMILCGVFNRFPKLQMLLAHSGGTLPFLAGRIKSCIEHDGLLKREGIHLPDPLDILRKNVYLDAVIYDRIGFDAAIDASGPGRLMFGTDHPFFPPLNDAEIWPSVTSNLKAISASFEESSDKLEAVRSINATRVLGLSLD